MWTSAFFPKKWLLVFACWCFTNLATGQNCNLVPALRPKIEQLFDQLGRLSLSNPDSCMIVCRRLDALAQICPDSFAYELINAMRFIADVHPSLDSFNFYISKAENYIGLYSRHLHGEQFYTSILSARYSRCRYWSHMGYYDRAFDCFEDMNDMLPGDFHNTYLDALHFAVPNQLGVQLYRKGNYPESLKWTLKVLEYLNSLPESDLLNMCVTHLYLARTFAKMGENANARRHYGRSVETFESVPPEHRDRTDDFFLDTYLGLCNFYLENQQPDSALAIIEKAFQLKLKEKWNFPAIHRVKGEILTKIGRLDEAEQSLLTAAQIADTIHFGKHVNKALILKALGNLSLASQEPETALSYFQNALTQLNEEFSAGEDFSENPGLHSTPSKRELLTVLQGKGRTLAAMFEREPARLQWLAWSLKTYTHALDLVQLLRFDYQQDESKELLSMQSFDLFEEAIETCYRLFQNTGQNEYREQAFAFAEKSKALSLLESLTDIGAKQFAGIPDSLLQQETDLKLQIALYERRAERAGSDETKKSNQTAAFEQRRKLDQLRKKLAAGYPAYFKIKNNLPTPGMEDTGLQLADDETFVEYFWGDRKMYFFTVTKDTARWGAFPVEDLLRKQVEDFKNLVANRKALLRPSNLRKFSRLGYGLFHRLVEPLDLKTPKVLLAADAWLNLLPFDALLTDSLPHEDYRQFPFHIRQRQITRVFSASVLTQDLKKSKPVAAGSLLVIAPNEQLQGRPDSLAAQFGGEFLLNENAGRQQVFDRAAHFRNLLFYAHAEADTIEPFIHLYEQEKLFLKDLYAQPVPAELVILAACEAGTGEVKRGEGVMSLARGFAYGGASNVGLTLWEVQSRATLQLAGDFLSGYFEKNNSPADAMHAAKLALLDHPPQGDASPYLWAGFVLVGR